MYTFYTRRAPLYRFSLLPWPSQVYARSFGCIDLIPQILWLSLVHCGL